MNYKKIAGLILIITLFAYVMTILLQNESVEDEAMLDEKIYFLNDELSYQREIKISIIEGGIEQNVHLEQYIIGLLPMCISMEFEMEAIKAQVVLLRSELIKEYQETGEILHRSNRGYLEVPQMQALWKSDFLAYYTKLMMAVVQTKGIFIVYEKEIILPSYFYISNGDTRIGSEILLSKEYPYLQSVSCESDFLAQDYFFSKEFTTEEWGEIFKIPDTKEMQIYTTYDNTNYCILVKIEYTHGLKRYEIVMHGEKFRQLLDLPSACFQIELKKDMVYIHGKGVGHGIGLSQYGANELAKENKNFMEIIHYYFYHIDFDKIE